MYLIRRLEIPPSCWGGQSLEIAISSSIPFWRSIWRKDLSPSFFVHGSFTTFLNLRRISWLQRSSLAAYGRGVSLRCRRFRVAFSTFACCSYGLFNFSPTSQGPQLEYRSPCCWGGLWDQPPLECDSNSNFILGSAFLHSHVRKPVYPSVPT